MLDLPARLDKGVFGMDFAAKRVFIYAISDLAWKPEERGPQVVGGSTSSSVSDFASNSCGLSLTWFRAPSLSIYECIRWGYRKQGSVRADAERLSKGLQHASKCAWTS